MYSRGDPQLDRELRSETRQRSHWRRDVLFLLGGTLSVLTIFMLVGLMSQTPAA